MIWSDSGEDTMKEEELLEEFREAELILKRRDRTEKGSRE